MAAASAVWLMVLDKKFMKLFVELSVMSFGLYKEYSGDVDTVEKKPTLEYRTMHSAYHITACFEREQL